MSFRPALVLLSSLAATLAPISAAAQNSTEKIVLEAYTGERPREADALMAPILDELTRRNYASGSRIAMSYTSVRSRPATTGGVVDPDELRPLVDAGVARWVEGAFPEAIETLERAMDIVRKEPASIARDQVRRRLVEKALIGLSLAYMRRGDAGLAEAYMGDVVRSFSEEPSRVTHGPEAQRLFRAVRAKLDERGRGRLEIKVSDPAAVVFLNEQYVAVGSISKSDLYPGSYRVYLRTKAQGRVHTVEVTPGNTTTLEVDLAFDAALVTSEWTGFRYADEAARRNEERDAVKFAREIHAREVILIGITSVDNAPVVVGKTVSVATGKPLLTANVSLDPAPSDKRLRALARYLAGESVDDPGIRVLTSANDQAETGKRRKDRSPRTGKGTRLWKWLAAGGGGAALVTGGVLLWMDGGCIDEPDCTRLRDTKLPGFAAVGAGVVLGVTATWLFLKDRRARRRSGVAVVPGRDGISVWAGWEF